MTGIDLTKISRVHFIGVGGIGISAIARMMVCEGKQVSANDLGEFEVVAALRKCGINTHIGVEKECIPLNVELIVYSIAWTTLSPDFLEYAKTRGVPMLSYPEMLGLLSKEKYTIAVSGTHGKTTTTAMIAQILIDAQLDPTVIVGSFLRKENTNFIPGKSEYFVVEACEYRRSFLNVYPNILVITNIDGDHLDYYKDMADIQSAFRELALRLTSADYVVCDPHDRRVAEILEGLSCSVVDYTAIEKVAATDGVVTLPGAHNKKNAYAACTVATLVGVNARQAIHSVNQFKGTWRRFEYRGETVGGAVVIDDYAHHPTEIEATLGMAREMYPDKNITAVFQPHLFSRTKDHKDRFARAFGLARRVRFLPIYGAREAFDESISSEMIINDIRAHHAPDDSAMFSDLNKAHHELSSYSKKDVIVVMGAGDITTLADMLVERSK